MESKDLTYYRQEDTIARVVEILDPNQNPNNERNFTSNLQPDASKIPLVFGHTLVTPVPIYTIDGPTTFINVPDETRTKIVFYAISANEHEDRFDFNNGDFVGDMYINGTKVTGLVTVSPSTNKPISGVDWRNGIQYSSGVLTSGGAVGGALNAGVTGNFGGNRFQFGSNLYVGYVKAGSDFTQHAFYKMFSGQVEGVLQGFDLIKDYPDHSNFDMLAVFYKFNKLYFDNESPKIQINYRRYPRFKTGKGTNPNGRYNPTVGNCLLEIFDNDQWGMGLTDDDYVYDDFRDLGDTMSGVFELTNRPLFEIVQSITEERTNYRLHELAGKLRFSQVNSTGIAITDDNIIGDLEIQYPDNNVAPTKLIATYNSYRDGTTEIEIGNDDTNVINIDLKTANNLADATTLVETIWAELNDTVTIRFTADRSFNQFSILDQCTLSTEVFSATITIVEISQNYDYTFNVTAKASAGSTTPNADLRGATPVIQINRNFYRPPAQEPLPDPPTPPGDDDLVLPPFPVPPAPNLRTILGLNHPYNRLNGADNTDWYLGGTVDGTTADPSYDANGIRTRFLPIASGAIYQLDFSLIKRDISKPTPTAIECVFDIGIGSEQSNNLIGFAYNSYRFDYPKFFNNEVEDVRYNNGRGWNIWNGKSWPNVYRDRPVYPGGSDPYEDQNNVFDYQYQTGDLADGTGRLRKIHVFNTDQTFRPNNYSYTWMNENMRVGGIFRLHFTAIYGSIGSPDSVEYIGTTTAYGDERGILPAYIAEARTVYGTFGKVFTENTQSPPSRSA